MKMGLDRMIGGDFLGRDYAVVKWDFDIAGRSLAGLLPSFLTTPDTAMPNTRGRLQKNIWLSDFPLTISK